MSSSDNNGNGWKRHEIYVMESLRRLEHGLELIQGDLKSHMDREEKSIVKIVKEIERLKIKASLWGGIAGAIPVIAYTMIKFL